MLDVISMGSNTLDIYVHTEKNQLINIRTQGSNQEYLSYPVGGKLIISKLMHNFGGNGANAAVCFAKLGLKTGYVGKVGADATGDQIIKSFKKNKVTFLGARGSESGTSIILDAMGEDRTILAFKGCNRELKKSELNFAKLKAKWFYLSSLVSDSLETMIAVAEHAKKIGAKISFNPSQTMIEKDQQMALSVAHMADIIVLNKEEAEMLVGMGSIEENLKKLVSLGPKIAAITDGKNGATCFHEGRYCKILPHKNIAVVETTGAGDAFAATMTGCIALKMTLDKALRMAINQAEAVIQGHGAQNNLLDRKKLELLISKDVRSMDCLKHN